jgi:hypothetical protein
MNKRYGISKESNSSGTFTNPQFTSSYVKRMGMSPLQVQAMNEGADEAGAAPAGSVGSSFKRMMGGGRLGELANTFLATRAGAAAIEQGMSDRSSIEAQIRAMELERPSKERDRRLSVLRGQLGRIQI